MFGTHFGKVQIPKNTAVIGTKISTNPRDLRVIEFYDEIPSMHNDSGFMDNRGNPVNYIAKSRTKTSQQESEKRIFNLSSMDPTPSHRNPSSGKNSFQFYSKSPMILPPGGSAEIEVVHDCSRQPNPDYQRCGRNPALSMKLLDEQRAIVRNNKSTPMAIGYREPLMVCYDRNQENILSEIHRICNIDRPKLDTIWSESEDENEQPTETRQLIIQQEEQEEATRHNETAQLFGQCSGHGDPSDDKMQAWRRLIDSEDGYADI